MARQPVQLSSCLACPLILTCRSVPTDLCLSILASDAALDACNMSVTVQDFLPSLFSTYFGHVVSLSAMLSGCGFSEQCLRLLSGVASTVPKSSMPLGPT